MPGKLIVIEGLDGSGKATQTQLLHENFQKRGIEVQKISFPNYAEPSSALVQMYLSGELGTHVEDVNAYAASSFYSVDRFASYQRHWKENYLRGGIIIADRYTTSNMVHQMVKLPKEEWDEYLSWLEDFEYHRLQLPKPIEVIYLDMDPMVSKELLKKRYQGDEEKKDLHEADFAYLLRCRETALYSAEKFSWKRILCSDETGPYPPQQIAELVWQAVSKDLNIK